MLLLRNPYTGSGELSDAFDLDGLQSALDTKPGAALVSRLLLLGASALFVAVLFGAYAKREDEKEKKDLTFGLATGGVVIAAGIAGTWALAEHASTGIQPGIAMPVDMLHLLAVAGWLGGLAALLVALHRTPDVTDDAVRRFSRVAFGSVLVLAATGLYQSWRQVGSWSALTGTRYGQLLLVKVALVAVLVGVAWVSRRWTARLAERTGPAAPPEAASTESEPAVPDSEGDEEVAPERAAQLSRQRAALTATKEKRARDADPDRSGLRRSVMVETGIAVVLLVVTTILTSTEPGRTEEEAARGSTAAAAPADRRRGEPEPALRHRRPERQGHGTPGHIARRDRREQRARVDRRTRRTSAGRPRGEARLHTGVQGHRPAAGRTRPPHRGPLDRERRADPDGGRLEDRRDRADVGHRPDHHRQEREDRLSRVSKKKNGLRKSGTAAGNREESRPDGAGGVSRRRLIGSAGAAGAAGLVLGAAGGATTYATTREERTALTTVGSTEAMFHGKHQAGITTPLQARGHLVAFDLVPGAGRKEAAALLRRWSAVAQRLMAGEVAKGGPGHDTGVALDAGPSSLTVTFGFGRTFFARTGLDDRRPAALDPLPAFSSDHLDAKRSDGDLWVQIGADDALVAFHALRALQKEVAPRPGCGGR